MTLSPPNRMRHLAIQAILPLVAATVSACHSMPTEPVRLVGCNGTPEVASVAPTHPAGTVTSRTSNLTGRPFGIRVSSGGIVYVTQQSANSVARFRLDDLTASAPVAVGGDPGDVTFTRNGGIAFVSNFFDGTVDVLGVASGRSTSVLRIDPTNAYRLALSPDDSLLYVTSTSGRLYAVDVTGHAATISVQLDGPLQGIALARDGLTVIVSGARGGVWRLNACTLGVQASTSLVAGTQDVVLATDETELFVANESGYIDVLNATTLQPLRRLTLTGLSPFGLAATPDGAQLYVTSPASGQVGVLDRVTGGVIKLYPVGGTPRRIAFDASGATATISNEGNWVDVIR